MRWPVAIALCALFGVGCPPCYPWDSGGTEPPVCRSRREYRTTSLPDAGGCRAVCPQHRELGAELEECYILEEADADAGTAALWHCQYTVNDCSNQSFDAGLN